MPRKAIPLPYQVDYLSVLDENGHLDKELEPDMPDELLLKLHRAMLLTRRFDERMLDLQRQGRIGTFGPIKGHEAAHLGAVATIRDSDWMVPSFRENGAELWRGRTMESFLLYYAGYDEGARIEDGRNDLPIAVPIASQTLHAVGLGFGINYRKTDQVVLVFFGDGATSEGDFHEAMNFAAVFQTPVVFVCQNNQWAISVPRDRQTRSETLAQKVVAYGMPGIQVDGNDILSVYAATKEAVDRARSGGGPTMIECVTYRVVMHTTSDDPKRYRSETEAQDWMKKDPLVRFQRYLIGRKLLTDKKIEALEAEVKAEIQASVERFEQQAAALGDPLDMFNHAYAEMPSTLLEQREELRRELGANGHTTAADMDDTAAIIRQIFTEQPLKATATLRPEVAANGEETGRG
ncbi:MAG TPA: pyruvate dehydrogenase (acetyl-transferring) E1 component subunit alpha [Chloroflexota bacterium]|nr:pyruvate dehydrogenase (acetyl-transferring) E1 component subunit alpha [Chloroflexota bacterium]